MSLKEIALANILDEPILGCLECNFEQINYGNLKREAKNGALGALITTSNKLVWLRTKVHFFRKDEYEIYHTIPKNEIITTGANTNTINKNYYCSEIIIYTAKGFCKFYNTYTNFKDFIELLQNSCNRDLSCLLECKNATLTNDRFLFRTTTGNWGDTIIDSQSFSISDMKMAIEDNNSLRIFFKDGTEKHFKIALSLDTGTMVSTVGLALFGDVGSTIAGNMAIDNKIKATSQQWATAINALISKEKLPEMIYCKYCGTKNKSIDPKCLHCGSILL